MFNACHDTYKKLEKTKWGIGGLLKMFVLVGPVKSAVKFALKIENDPRWDDSMDTVLRKFISLHQSAREHISDHNRPRAMDSDDVRPLSWHRVHFLFMAHQDLGRLLAQEVGCSGPYERRNRQILLRRELVVALSEYDLGTMNAALLPDAVSARVRA